MCSLNILSSAMAIGNIKMCYEMDNKVEVVWEIENFSSLRPQSAKSPSFKWSSVDWMLSLEYTENKVELFLNKTTSQNGLQVLFKLGIQLTDRVTEMRCSFFKKFESSGSWGTQVFITESELAERKHQLLPEGILKIACLIVIASPDTLIESWEEKDEDLEDLSSDFKALYDCADSSDIIIVVGERNYPAHKAILAVRSSVFAEMFKHNMEKMMKTGIVNVSDCEPTSFKDFLLYLYTGRVENFSWNNVFNIYKIADKYNVRQLKVLCVKYMMRNLTTTNLFDTVILANQFDDSGLMFVAQNFFNRNTLEIITGDDWEQFVKNNFPLANEFLIKKFKK